MRVAINLLTEDPRNPSGAHWFWTRVIPHMAAHLKPGEELYLMVSPACRPLHDAYGPGVRYMTFPWSNEHRILRTLSEQIYSPVRLPMSRIDILNTLVAPTIKPCHLVLHIKTMHAFMLPNFPKITGAYRRRAYRRSVALADALIINSASLRSQIEQFLPVDPSVFRLVPEAVDHDLFKPDDRGAARERVRHYGLTRPFALFVSSLWPYKNCAGLLKAWAHAHSDLGGRQLAIVGGGAYYKHRDELKALAHELGIASDTVFVGAVPLSKTPSFYQAADVFVYPSLNETFGLPILEAMACGCPVVTSNLTAMPETAGGAAELCDPTDPRSIAAALLMALGPKAARLRDLGLRRASQFNWATTATKTLDVYREVHERRRVGANAR
jgi:glycosyltransferase involved in cell wall biosynthesis